jgi:alpha-ketoglutarate-dependent taurine dioxygenase
MTNSLAIRPIAGTVGAEIAGVDLARDLDAATIAAIRRTWFKHLVIFFRGQPLARFARSRSHLAYVSLR